MIRRQTSRISRSIGITALAGALLALKCAPEVTEPANTDVTGTWFAPGPAAGLTNVTVKLTQRPDGVIVGTYTATGTRGLQFCPSRVPCPISGSIINGSNTVLQVFFELTDAGQFSGQLFDGNLLKGAMSRISTTQPIQFTKS
jgi:hypothetical protein